MNPPEKPTPSPETRKALVALLRADAGVSAVRRARILAAFDAPEGNEGRAFGLIHAPVAAAKVGVATSTVLRWAEDGAIAARRQGDRLTLVDLEEVKTFVRTRKAP